MLLSKSLGRLAALVIINILCGTLIFIWIFPLKASLQYFASPYAVLLPNSHIYLFSILNLHHKYGIVILYILYRRGIL